MRITTEAPVPVITAVVCDCCKKEYHPYYDEMELQEFLHYTNTGGYASIFGDGVTMTLDLCQRCTRTLLGDYMRFRSNDGG